MSVSIQEFAQRELTGLQSDWKAKYWQGRKRCKDGKRHTWHLVNDKCIVCHCTLKEITGRLPSESVVEEHEYRISRLMEILKCTADTKTSSNSSSTTA